MSEKGFMREIKTDGDALAWFEDPTKKGSKYRKSIDGTEIFEDCGFAKDDKHKCYYTYKEGKEKGFPKKFEPDSSPKAWEHYIRHYEPSAFGTTIDKYGNKNETESQQNYSFNSLKYNLDKFSRIVAAPQVYANNFEARTFDGERLGGDCDFNFNEGKIASFLLKEKNTHNEGTAHLFFYCHRMHHTLLNFSLMQATGGMQLFKQVHCNNDRLDRFLFFLNEFYSENDDFILTSAVAHNRNAQLKEENTEKLRAALRYYLKEVAKDVYGTKKIYRYCSEIYFLPTYGHPTSMMKKYNVNIATENWDVLLDSNKKLIADLLASGAKFIDTPRRVVEYMLLAVRFWQAKEEYFKLMDEVFKAANQQ